MGAAIAVKKTLPSAKPRFRGSVIHEEVRMAVKGNDKKPLQLKMLSLGANMREVEEASNIIEETREQLEKPDHGVVSRTQKLFLQAAIATATVSYILFIRDLVGADNPGLKSIVMSAIAAIVSGIGAMLSKRWERLAKRRIVRNTSERISNLVPEKLGALREHTDWKQQFWP